MTLVKKPMISNFTGISGYDLMIVMLNVMLFIVVQSLFFIFVGSNEQITATIEKLYPVRYLLYEYDEGETQVKDKLLEPEILEKLIQGTEDQKEKDSGSISYMMNMTWFPFLVCAGVASLGIFTEYYKYKRSGTFAYGKTVNVILAIGVLFAYSSELATYFLVVSKWQHIAALRMIKDAIL